MTFMITIHPYKKAIMLMTNGNKMNLIRLESNIATLSALMIPIIKCRMSATVNK